MFDQAQFEKALQTPRLRQPIPEYLTCTRGGGKIRVLTEPELNASTRRWFVDYERKVELYAGHGFDISWTMEWSKKYWWSWLMRDMSLNDELYTPDLKYKDVSTLGRTLVGLDEFVKYNFAFFDAIPDWRYDPLPGQIYIDITADGEVRIVVRYIGSGHWSGALRLYPYDETAPAIQGTGNFVQCTAVDRYHFTEDGKMYEGETLFDVLDATQTAGILPGDDSRMFHALLKTTKLMPSLENIKQKIPFLRNQ